MSEFVYVRTPTYNECYENTFLIYTCNSETYKSDRPDIKKCKEIVFSKSDFAIRCKELRLWYLDLVVDSQEDLDYFADTLGSCEIDKLYLHFKDRLQINLSPMERFTNTKGIYLFELLRIEKLWNFSKNSTLKLVHILNCNRLRDFSQFENSGIETLKLFGCNGLSSFTSKLHIDDFSFLTKMPNLKSLHMEIVKDKPAEYYLNILAGMKNLEEFICPESFFTFEQFAWLASRLPNTKGLEPSLYCKELGTYSIIGNRKPRFLKDKQRVEKYEKQYGELKEKFKFQINPPV